MAGPDGSLDHVDLIDEIAMLGVSADNGDLASEERLLEMFHSDARLQPGSHVHRMDLPSDVMIEEPLSRS